MARRGGWRRLGRSPRFRYVDARGVPIADEQKLERIRSLVIPPAWRDVWISPHPGAKLQATGLDKAGRRQYLYHPEFRAAQEQAKFDRLVRFGERLPALRQHLDRHLDLGPHEREWACAIAVNLVNRAWFRVGSERYARSSRTYGITTLTKRHASVRGNRLTWRDGRTLEHFRERRLRAVTGRQLGLLPEEEALLSLLRSWRLRRARAAA